MRDNAKKRAFNFTFVILMVSLIVAPFATAGNITIWDKMGSGSGWNGVQEDQEVEPGNLSTQAWDLEGFFLNNRQLTMIGGFDFKNGVTYSNYTYKSGDIFIDTNGDAVYGPGTPGSNNSEANLNNKFGYEYVLDLDFSTMKYTVYNLTSPVMLTTVIYPQPTNVGSNPWKYYSGGTPVPGYVDLPFLYYGTLSDSATGFSGGTHYGLTVDLGFLNPGTTFTSHFTIECGNDDLMGQGTIPTPEPGTMILLGSGLVGLAGWGRKKFRK